MVDPRPAQRRVQHIRQLPQGTLRIVQPQLGQGAQLLIQIGKAAAVPDICNIRHLGAGCAHRFVQVGGFAVGGAVDLVAHFLHNFNVHQLQGRFCRSDHGEEILHLFTFLDVEQRRIPSAGIFPVGNPPVDSPPLPEHGHRFRDAGIGGGQLQVVLPLRVDYRTVRQKEPPKKGPDAAVVFQKGGIQRRKAQPKPLRRQFPLAGGLHHCAETPCFALPGAGVGADGCESAGEARHQLGKGLGDAQALRGESHAILRKAPAEQQHAVKLGPGAAFPFRFRAAKLPLHFLAKSHRLSRLSLF